MKHRAIMPAMSLAAALALGLPVASAVETEPQPPVGEQPEAAADLVVVEGLISTLNPETRMLIVQAERIYPATQDQPGRAQPGEEMDGNGAPGEQEPVEEAPELGEQEPADEGLQLGEEEPADEGRQFGEEEPADEGLAGPGQQQEDESQALYVALIAAEDAKISLDGQDAKLDELRSGDPIKAFVTERDGRRTAVRIEVQREQPQPGQQERHDQQQQDHGQQQPGHQQDEAQQQQGQAGR